MSKNTEQWKAGYIAGYRSVRPGYTPTIPTTPTLPSGRDYYQAGYDAGQKSAR